MLLDLIVALFATMFGIDLKKENEEGRDGVEESKVNEINHNEEVEEVLMYYYEIGVKLPFDILEELQFINLEDKALIFDRIELMRQHWKLENSKKLKNPYK